MYQLTTAIKTDKHFLNYKDRWQYVIVKCFGYMLLISISIFLNQQFFFLPQQRAGIVLVFSKMYKSNVWVQVMGISHTSKDQVSYQ
jgi:hypothetical protein